ncbi:MAG: hypothetical protein V7K27_31000 [Nostoc sp.]|uniref:hypothetical protein n=1 Tax=Nostoc sp. TaxID=1180 RepID=UPI002FFB8C8B
MLAVSRQVIAKNYYPCPLWQGFLFELLRPRQEKLTRDAMFDRNVSSRVSDWECLCEAPPQDLRQQPNEVHFQQEAGNEVVKEF